MRSAELKCEEKMNYVMERPRLKHVKKENEPEGTVWMIQLKFSTS